MELKERIDKLKKARDVVATIFAVEAIDEFPDNGNLSVMTEAILNLNTAIKALVDRKK